MENIFSKIINFIKVLFSNNIDIRTENDKSKLNEVKKNKNCNISIVNNGVEKNNEQK